MLDFAKSLLSKDCFRLLVTTFDDYILQDAQPSTSSSSSSSLPSSSPSPLREYTGFNRPILWIPLPPLQLPREEWTKLGWFTERLNRDAELDYLLALTGGHARSLQWLFEVMESNHELTCLETKERLWDEFSKWITFGAVDTDVWQHLLTLVFSGTRINTSAKIPNGE